MSDHLKMCDYTNTFHKLPLAKNGRQITHSLQAQEKCSMTRNVLAVMVIVAAGGGDGRNKAKSHVERVDTI